MTNRTLPTIFVSHGAPTFVLGDSPAARFLREFGSTLGRPKGIVAVSAHWETDGPVLGAAGRPPTVHDFYGFPEPLYDIRYPAPGSPALAETAAGLLAAAGIVGGLDPVRGLDHGAWVPLSLMYPKADIPVVQLSVQTARGTAWHVGVGAALSDLRRNGVLVMGSGGAVHNLGAFDPGSPAVEGWARTFDDWLCETLAEGAVDKLVDYRRLRPEASRAHPTEEHLLPLFTALGAVGKGAKGRALHRSFLDGSLSMAAYAFE